MPDYRGVLPLGGACSHFMPSLHFFSCARFYNLVSLFVGLCQVLSGFCVGFSRFLRQHLSASTKLINFRCSSFCTACNYLYNGFLSMFFYFKQPSKPEILGNHRHKCRKHPPGSKYISNNFYLPTGGEWLTSRKIIFLHVRGQGLKVGPKMAYPPQGKN